MFKVPENIKSKYEFVTLAAKRAEQLQGGAVPRTEVDTNKVTVIAQAEVAVGLVGVYNPEVDKPEGMELEEEE